MVSNMVWIPVCFNLPCNALSAPAAREDGAEGALVGGEFVLCSHLKNRLTSFEVSSTSAETIFVSKVSLAERPVLLQHPLAHREHPVRGNGLSPPVV